MIDEAITELTGLLGPGGPGIPRGSRTAAGQPLPSASPNPAAGTHAA
jgi:hypothetical protein